VNLELMAKVRSSQPGFGFFAGGKCRAFGHVEGNAVELDLLDGLEENGHGTVAVAESTIHHPRGTGKSCCFALHSPVAYSQAHRNPQHWLALASGSNPAPAHHSGTHVQLDSEPRMPAGQAFPLPRDVFLVMPIGRCGSDVAAAALRTVHGLVIVGCTPSLAYGELRRLDGGGPLHRAKI
jgi:hypothetical protein